MKLAKIYNAPVTHLQHHLPMVAYALGDANGDTALVQLVHIEAEKRTADIEILPPHTALNKVDAEIGGHYSCLKRCLLLAGKQRAFVHANFPEDSTFIEVAIGNAHHYGAAVLRTLEWSIVWHWKHSEIRDVFEALKTNYWRSILSVACIGSCVGR